MSGIVVADPSGVELADPSGNLVGIPVPYIGTTSGTYSFNLPISELVLDAYERCGLTGTQLSTQYIQSARRSLNLVLSSWSNRGVNLWTAQEVVQYMPQGAALFLDDASCVDILPDSVTIRQYQMGTAVSVSPQFTTKQGSTSVTISGFASTPVVGGYVSVVVPVSIGGVVVQGFYPVVSVPGSSQAVVTASAAAGSAATGGTVPSFTTTAATATVQVVLAGHGQVPGSSFNVQEPTAVGGLVLSGPYFVTAVADANNFSIASPVPAGFGQTVSENGGLTMLATQAVVVVSGGESGNPITDGDGNIITDGDGNPILDGPQIAPVVTSVGAAPVDILMYPLSRGDWMAIPDKYQQGRPTSFWIDRQVVPQINIWPVPDANGPYELRYWRSRQVQDADLVSAQVLAVPYRFLEAFASDLAAHLAMKWAAPRVKDLAAYALAQWTLASEEDRERTSTFLVPDVSPYFD